jgi:hypothetical protein
VNLPQFAKGNPFNRRVPPAVAMMKHLLRIFIGERADHT